MPKVTIVGAGNVGGAAAERLARSPCVDELVLVDAVPGLAEAIALDIAQCAPLDGFQTRVVGGIDYAPTEHSDVVVVTAGRARQPGQDRLDLLVTNAEIVSSVIAQAASRSPFAVLLIVTNPLDEMTYHAWRTSGFPAERVIGMAGVLDSARLRTFLGWELKIPPTEIEAMTLGSHGDTMVPVLSRASARGRPVAELIDRGRLEQVAARARDGGAEIVSLLKRGSAFHAPGASIAEMVEAIVDDRHEVMPACVWVDGAWGISGVFLGVPAVLGRRGVERIEQLELAPDEIAALRVAASVVAERCTDIDGLRAVRT